ncbi:efflux RND transporter periplasmic adaptor subunit [Rhodohalobacter sp. 8-1]|uniref:efflux RND transporter periplasmic adaptor subunit n=1 Tax=Rhodohalobacter sp. 8-1 TaxID=3131972 RepID=UPI0030EE5561
MNSRKLSVISGVIIFVATLFLSWYIVSGSEEETTQESDTEAAPVLMVTYQPESIQSSIRFTGRVIPFEQFEIYAEVTGIFEHGDRPFKTGTAFNRGDILMQLNNDEQRQQLQAARYEFSAIISQLLPDISIDYPGNYDAWSSYLDNMDASESLRPLPEVADRQFRMYLNRQNVFSRFYSIRQQEVRLDKFTIRAPFDGVVTDHQINPGALVQSGQMLGQFTGTETLEIEASIPAREAQYVSTGATITVRTTGINSETYSGTVTRKNALVEPGTQSVKIFVDISDSDLEPGYYLEGDIRGQVFADAFKIHKDILIRDNELFTVKDGRATLTTVELRASAGDSMIVSGLEPGTTIIDEFRNAAFEDTRVTRREEQ